MVNMSTSPEAGPSKHRSSPSITVARPSAVERAKKVWRSITERPSLLSTGSDSQCASDSQYGSSYENPDGDPRLYAADARRRSRGRNRHMTESRVDGDEDGDLADDEKQSEAGPASRTVVDNDFASWIDPATGRLLVHETSVSKDDAGSIRSARSTEEDTQTSHYGKLSRTTDSLYMSWCKTFVNKVGYFLNMSFPEKAKERLYLKDVYFLQRQVALSASIFFVVMWILVCATTPRPYDVYDYYAYIGIYGALTLPLLPIIFFNVNYRMPVCYQIWLTIATWVLPDITLIKVKTCGVWEPGVQTCDTRSFFIAFAAAIGQPVLALLALNQCRLCAIFGASQFFVLMAIFYFHQPDTPTSFYRDAIYYIVFHIFILIIDAFIERRDRQMFELREQLKKQFKETQRAQQKERRASDLNKRFISYIFHEVRVPLNTALLSVQNLEADGTFRDIPEDQKECVVGLSSSLALMEKVLNDVLSFNRMESGNFTQAKAPFDFHSQMAMCAKDQHVTAHAKGLAVLTDFDQRIDDLDCPLVGDEMRLRQIICNLISNSLKFTTTGSITLRTRLLSPLSIAWATDGTQSPLSTAGVLPPIGEQTQSYSTSQTLDVEKGPRDEDGSPLPALVPSKRRGRMAIVRIEVEDTGVGLRPADMEETRLFSPYVQTEIGRRQGGKGTGLGLAFVRQIVQLNKGRLGVTSEYGKGSTFWLELPFQLKRGSQSTSTSGPRGHGSYPSTGTYVGSPTSIATDKIMPQPMVDNVMTEGPGQMRSTDHALDLESILSPATPDRRHDTGLGQGEGNRARAISTSTFTESIGMPGTPATPRQDVEPINVLVVDDDQLTRRLMAKMLCRLGHHVTTAKNGKEGLEVINAAYRLTPDSPAVDIVFLDNQMPEMSGVEVTRAVRKYGDPVYIVGCTGNALREDQEEYTGAGADQVLTKPIKQAALVEAIAMARMRVAGETVPRGWAGHVPVKSLTV